MDNDIQNEDYDDGNDGDENDGENEAQQFIASKLTSDATKPAKPDQQLLDAIAEKKASRMLRGVKESDTLQRSLEDARRAKLGLRR